MYDVFELCHPGTGSANCVHPGDDLCRVWRSQYTSGTTHTPHITVRGTRDVCPEFHQTPPMVSLPSTWPTSVSRTRDGTNVKWCSSIGHHPKRMVPGSTWMSMVSTL